MVDLHCYAGTPCPATLRHAHNVTGRPVLMSESGFRARGSGLPNTKGSGPLVWTPTIATPDGVWEHTFAVTVEAAYTGTLVNHVQVVSEEGATGESFVVTNGRKVYLPLVIRK